MYIRIHLYRDKRMLSDTCNDLHTHLVYDCFVTQAAYHDMLMARSACEYLGLYLENEYIF